MSGQRSENIRCIALCAAVKLYLDSAGSRPARAVSRVGPPPAADLRVSVHGLVRQMRETLGGLQQGLLLAVVVVVLAADKRSEGELSCR